jgi:hypothetical protein
MKKPIIITVIVLFLLSIFQALAYNPSCSTIGALPYGADWVEPNKVNGAQVLGNDNLLLTPVDTICGTDLPLLPGKADNETITGAWTFTGATTFGNFNYSSSGFTGTEFRLNADNAGEPVFSCFTYGGTSSGSLINAGLCIQPAGYLAGYGSGISSSGLLKIQGATATTGNELTTYAQVGKLATTNTWDLAQTFSAAPVLSTECSASNNPCTKSYIDLADAALTAGAYSYLSSGAPSGMCTLNAGVIHNDGSDNVSLYICTSSGGYVQVGPNAITKNLSFSGTAAISGILNFATSSGIVNLRDPVNAQEPVTKNYFDTQNVIDTLYVQTAQVTTSSEMLSSILTSGGVGSLTIPANTLTAGDVIKINARGTVDIDAGGSCSGGVWGYFRNYLGSEYALLQPPCATVQQSANPPSCASYPPDDHDWVISGEWLVKDLSSSGTLVFNGEIQTHSNWSTSGGLASGTITNAIRADSQTIDVTAEQMLDLQFNLYCTSSGATVNSFTLESYNAVLEKY